MIKMGIDASTTCIGWAIFDEDNLIDYGKIKPNKECEDWRSRVQNFIPQLQDIITQYNPSIIYVEDVPLMKKQMLTLVQLGSVQGMLLSISVLNNIDIEFISVSTWRKNIGLFDGTEKGKERDEMKVKSIHKANELFNLNLKCMFTKSGNYCSTKSDDDISDAILVCASTMDRYKVERKTFGRR